MDKTATGRIHSVETFGAVDGPGVRYVLFLQGCRLKCLYCHNPDSWDCTGGKAITAQEAFHDIQQYRSFIKNGGVTFSGGEPLLQPEFVLELLHLCKKSGLHTAVDTAGSVDLSLSRPVIDAADMLLLDIKVLDEALCLKLTGQSGVNTLRTLEYCEQIGKRVWIRHVLVPGYTLRRDRVGKLADYLQPFSCIEKVELLPFHKMGEYKWETLHMDYQLTDTPAPTAEETALAREIFLSRSFSVQG